MPFSVDIQRRLSGRLRDAEEMQRPSTRVYAEGVCNARNWSLQSLPGMFCVTCLHQTYAPWYRHCPSDVRSSHPCLRLMKEAAASVSLPLGIDISAQVAPDGLGPQHTSSIENPAVVVRKKDEFIR